MNDNDPAGNTPPELSTAGGIADISGTGRISIKAVRRERFEEAKRRRQQQRDNPAEPEQAPAEPEQAPAPTPPPKPKAAPKANVPAVNDVVVKRANPNAGLLAHVVYGEGHTVYCVHVANGSHRLHWIRFKLGEYKVVGHDAGAWVSLSPNDIQAEVQRFKRADQPRQQLTIEREEQMGLDANHGGSDPTPGAVTQ